MFHFLVTSIFFSLFLTFPSALGFIFLPVKVKFLITFWVLSPLLKKYDHHIKRLRLNNIGEYINKKFIIFCSFEGIHMQKLVPYTPQQNGMAKRNNQTSK
jgi:hypothetical protein